LTKFMLKSGTYRKLKIVNSLPSLLIPNFNWVYYIYL
jgi:hypothetical protein